MRLLKSFFVLATLLSLPTVWAENEIPKEWEDLRKTFVFPDIELKKYEAFFKKNEIPEPDVAEEKSYLPLGFLQELMKGQVTGDHGSRELALGYIKKQQLSREKLGKLTPAQICEYQRDYSINEGDVFTLNLGQINSFWLNPESTKVEEVQAFWKRISEVQNCNHEFYSLLYFKLYQEGLEGLKKFLAQKPYGKAINLPEQISFKERVRVSIIYDYFRILRSIEYSAKESKLGFPHRHKSSEVKDKHDVEMADKLLNALSKNPRLRLHDEKELQEWTLELTKYRLRGWEAWSHKKPFDEVKEMPSILVKALDRKTFEYPAGFDQKDLKSMEKYLMEHPNTFGKRGWNFTVGNYSKEYKDTFLEGFRELDKKR